MSSGRDIIIFEDGNSDIATQAIFTSTELILPETIGFEDWAAVGKSLQTMSRAIHWWIGDWIRFGERKWGEKYAQAIDETPFAYQTLANDVWVASAIEPSRRRENLTFNHHAVIAALPAIEQDKWLNMAEREDWSSRQLWVESRDTPPRPVTFYDGMGRLELYGFEGGWAVVFEPDSGFEGGLGDHVHVIIKEGP